MIITGVYVGRRFFVDNHLGLLKMLSSRAWAVLCAEGESEAVKSMGRRVSPLWVAEGGKGSSKPLRTVRAAA